MIKLALGLEEGTVCFAIERVKRTYRGDVSRLRAFDVVAECGDYVMINKTKGNLRSEDVTNLIEMISISREYFPEYNDWKIIGSVASVSIDESVVNFVTTKGILALSVGDELMDMRNPEGFKPTVW